MVRKASFLTPITQIPRDGYSNLRLNGFSLLHKICRASPWGDITKATATHSYAESRGAAISTKAGGVSLFDHLVDDGEHTWRNGDTERFGGP